MNVRTTALGTIAALLATLVIVLPTGAANASSYVDTGDLTVASRQHINESRPNRQRQMTVWNHSTHCTVVLRDIMGNGWSRTVRPGSGEVIDIGSQNRITAEGRGCSAYIEWSVR